MDKNKELPRCAECCFRSHTNCIEKTCRFWIDYEEDFNCSLISIHLNGPMTLIEVAKRLNLSFVRISQIEKQALTRMSKRIKM